MKHLKYARYILRHKWFVFVQCAKRGILWRGLMHDMSKFLPSEWMPYANFFYGAKPQKRDESGYYKPTDTGDAEFDFAWLLHQKKNRHHWQWWVLPEDDGGTKVLPMQEPYRTEMICDWLGAGAALGTPSVNAWYKKNGHKMQLHPDTRAWVEKELELLP